MVTGLVSDLPAQLLPSVPLAFSEPVCEGGEGVEGILITEWSFYQKLLLVSKFGMSSEFFPCG